MDKNSTKMRRRLDLATISPIKYQSIVLVKLILSNDRFWVKDKHFGICYNRL